ncbi:hypothetical protein EZS27_020558 [termite gut metagenome]|uniref:Uncharacterized protein n=1 Tax=termite gut metagenome TaxID=433724 RepID=A0A5J4RD17_9ZZZZ
MAIGDSINEKQKEKLFRLSLLNGNVFINKFDGIDHPKMFIVAGICKEKVFTCSVYINSNIHPSLIKKQHLLDLQVNIKGSKYDFLTHDSFVCCSTPLPIKTKEINDWINKGTCRSIGSIDDEDLENITKTIIESGLLSLEEIELYFK